MYIYIYIYICTYIYNHELQFIFSKLNFKALEGLAALLYFNCFQITVLVFSDLFPVGFKYVFLFVDKVRNLFHLQCASLAFSQELEIAGYLNDQSYFRTIHSKK